MRHWVACSRSITTGSCGGPKELGRKEDAEDLIMQSVSDVIEKQRAKFRGTDDAAVLNLLLKAIGCDIKDALRKRGRARKRKEYPEVEFVEDTGRDDEEADDAFTREENIR